MAVLSNYRAIGEGLFCIDQRMCMANQATTFTVQAKDAFLNNAVSCKESVEVIALGCFCLSAACDGIHTPGSMSCFCLSAACDSRLPYCYHRDISFHVAA